MSGPVMDIPMGLVAGWTTAEKEVNAARLHAHFAKRYGALKDADPPDISYPDAKPKGYTLHDADDVPRFVRSDDLVNPPVDALRETLDTAYHQAMHGKGRERHGGAKPFADQPIFTIAELLDGSIDGHAYQATKKVQEAARMAKAGRHGAARQELLGAIIYAAAASMILEKKDA